MDREGSPPPYTTSPDLPPPPNDPAHDASSPRHNDSTPQYLIHLPGTSRSTYHSLHSSGHVTASPEYPTNTIRIIPRISTARSSRQNIVIVPRQPVEAAPSVIYRPNISVSSPNGAQNVVIVPQQPAQRPPTSDQQSSISIPISPQENALINRPARQSTPSRSLQGSLASSATDDLPPPFVDEPLPSFAEAIAESNRRFPREFGFYYAFASFSDMVIAQRDDSNPLYYISTHHRLSNQKNVILHSGRFIYSPPLATADFPKFTSTINIELMATPIYGAEHHHLEKSAGSARVFSITLPGSDVQEHFEWKRSQGEEVAVLHGRSHGEKLIRVNTGEIVAAWTAPLMVSKKGQIRFLGNREALGEKFEVMVVISMLAIMGKDHGGGKIGNPNTGGAGARGTTGATS